METKLTDIKTPLTISEETKCWLSCMAQTNEVYNVAYDRACDLVGDSDSKMQDLTAAYKSFYSALAALMAQSVSQNLCNGNEI